MLVSPAKLKGENPCILPADLCSSQRPPSFGYIADHVSFLQAATWHPSAASPHVVTVGQLAAHLERLQKAVAEAEDRNRALEAQLAEAQSRLEALRTESAPVMKGPTETVALAQGGQAAEETRAAATKDQLRPAGKPAQFTPVKVRPLVVFR